MVNSGELNTLFIRFLKFPTRTKLFYLIRSSNSYTPHSPCIYGVVFSLLTINKFDQSCFNIVAEITLTVPLSKRKVFSKLSKTMKTNLQKILGL